MSDEGVMDVVDEVVDSGAETSVDTVQPDTQEAKTDDPYSSKASREYSQWLKALREEKLDDPAAAKFARLSKDNHARLYQLQQMEPRGIDGVRETYALLDSVMHGELKGRDAIGALQDEIRAVQEMDQAILAGDAAALENFDDEMKAGIVKMTPAILDMARNMDPESYSRAVLPHFVEALKSSELVSSFNGLVDVLNEAPPKWLTPDQKSQWTEERIQRVMSHAGKMGQWFNAQQQKAGELPKQNGQIQGKPGEKPSELDTLRKEQETQHWNTAIQPTLDRHADSTFQKLFAPYSKRLRLDSAATSDLKESFIRGVVGKAKANPAYVSQMGRYHSQRKPDGNIVSNFAKVEFDKHAKTVMDALVNQRYKPFLTGGQRTQAAAPVAGQKKGPVAPNVQIVTQKPSNVDYPNTPREWLHEKKYKTLDGKIVQLQR